MIPPATASAASPPATADQSAYPRILPPNGSGRASAASPSTSVSIVRLAPIASPAASPGRCRPEAITADTASSPNPTTMPHTLEAAAPLIPLTAGGTEISSASGQPRRPSRSPVGGVTRHDSSAATRQVKGRQDAQAICQLL